MRLREVTESDFAAFYEFQRDPEANVMAAFDARDRAAHDAHWARIVADPEVTVLTVEDAGEVAGNVVAWTEDGARLVGYWIGRAHWGQGLATRALAALIERETARPLLAHVARHNAGSIRVLEKCGFTPTGAGDEIEIVLALRAPTAGAAGR